MTASRIAGLLAVPLLAVSLAACSSSTSKAPSTTNTSSGSAAGSTQPSVDSASTGDSATSATTAATSSSAPTSATTSAAFVARGETYKPVIDGVHVSIQSADVPVPPSAFTNVSQPGDAVQHASITTGDPYRYFGLSAVAYGHTSYGAPSFPKASAGAVAAWRQAEINQSGEKGGPGTPSDGPVAMIFGKPVVGTVVHRVDAPLAGKQIHIEKIFWVVAAGDRIWELSMERDENGMPADYGTGIQITAADLSNPTTM